VVMVFCVYVGGEVRACVRACVCVRERERESVHTCSCMHRFGCECEQNVFRVFHSKLSNSFIVWNTSVLF
jgi:hypothetical protein